MSPLLTLPAGSVDGPPRSAPTSSLPVPADLAMYAALAGRPPTIDASPVDPLSAAGLAVRANPWSPAVVGAYVAAVVRAKGPRLNRAEVSAWVRRQSAVARRRLGEGRGRVHERAFTVAAAAEEADD